MDKRISLKIEKVKGSKKLNGVVDEYYRNTKTAKYYDNSRRKLDVTKTDLNYWLENKPADIDADRKERIKEFNKVKKAKKVDRGRKFSDNQNDCMQQVVQLSKEQLASMSREEITRMYMSIHFMMKEKEEEYGECLACVIHFDEESVHMQRIVSTLDLETGKNLTKKFTGADQKNNRKGLADRQTMFVEDVKSLGFDVERGIKRVDKTYSEEIKEMCAYFDIDPESVNRHNDFKLLDAYRDVKKRESELTVDKHSVARKSAVLRSAEKHVKIKESDLNKREQSIDKRENDLELREKELQARTSMLDRHAESIREHEQSVNDKLQEFIEYERVLLARENAVKEESAKNERNAKKIKDYVKNNDSVRAIRFKQLAEEKHKTTAFMINNRLDQMDREREERDFER